MILYLSSDHGSMPATSRFVRPLLEFIFPTAPEEVLQIYHGYVRKAAHFTEYAILAFFALRAFLDSRVESVKKLRYVLPIFLVAAIAVMDELNQSFLASRTGSVWDVLLDISGGLAMVLFLWAANLRRGKLNQNDGKSSNTD